MSKLGLYIASNSWILGISSHTHHI